MDMAALRREIGLYLELGYRGVKIKIGGAPPEEDRRRIEAVLDMLPYGCALAVDANGRFTEGKAIAYGAMLSDHPVMWDEGPVDPGDLGGHAAVAASYTGTIATGENLLSGRGRLNLVRYGGLRRGRDKLQMDPVVSHGIGEYLSTVRALEA